MSIDRRLFLQFLLGTAAASTVDFEQLLWMPKPIIVVPAMPCIGGINRSPFLFSKISGAMVVAAWDEYVKKDQNRRLNACGYADVSTPSFWLLKDKNESATLL